MMFSMALAPLNCRVLAWQYHHAPAAIHLKASGGGKSHACHLGHSRRALAEDGAKILLGRFGWRLRWYGAKSAWRI